MSVDAIVCFVKEHKFFIDRCLESLKDQVRQSIIVFDGEDETDEGVWSVGLGHHAPIFPRETRHGPANSFNYGAFHSNADWLLYVDPHCIFKPTGIKQMLAAAGEEYPCVLGTGYHYTLTPEDPWFQATSTMEFPDVPLTFLMHRSLWESLGGIPEPPYCHMDVLGDTLKQQGILIAQVKNVVTHDPRKSFSEFALSVFQGAYSYGALAKAGYEKTKVVQQVEQFTPEQVTLLVKLLLTSLHQLGALTGYEKVPQEPLDLKDILFDWVVTK